jgi:hypothetical protein
MVSGTNTTGHTNDITLLPNIKQVAVIVLKLKL